MTKHRAQYNNNEEGQVTYLPGVCSAFPPGWGHGKRMVSGHLRSPWPRHCYALEE